MGMDFGGDMTIPESTTTGITVEAMEVVMGIASTILGLVLKHLLQ